MESYVIKRNWIKIITFTSIALFIGVLFYNNISNHYIAIFCATIPFSLLAFILEKDLNPLISLKFGKSKVIIKLRKNKFTKEYTYRVNDLIAHEYDYSTNIYYLETKTITYRFLCSNLYGPGKTEVSSQALFNIITNKYIFIIKALSAV